MASETDLNITRSFNWLCREARGSSYINYSDFSNDSACSFDFGDDGYAASCDYGGGLLHMSARDQKQGVIFAHGDFKNTYHSSLSRAQRQQVVNATFGLRIPDNQELFKQKVDSENPPSMFELGDMIERGCFNYRWPFHEYILLLNKDGKPNSRETGTCATVSFVRNDVLYQVIRLEKGCRPEADSCFLSRWDGQLVLSIGGSIKFGIFSTGDSNTEVKYTTVGPHLGIIEDENKTQLEFRVYQLCGDEYNLLSLGEPPENDNDDGIGKRIGSFYLSANLTETKPQGLNGQKSKNVHVFIAELRLRKGGHEQPWPSTPTSEETYEYIGIDPGSKMNTAAMWDAIFQRREDLIARYSELSEVDLIGRCMEKILTVELVPTTFSNDQTTNFRGHALALVSNLFVRPTIDLQSLFWNVRFLVKAYRLLSKALGASRDDPSDQICLQQLTIKFQMQRLQAHIEQDFKIAWDGAHRADEWSQGKSPLDDCLAPDHLVPEDGTKDKVAFLKWYHYVSVMELLARQKPLPKAWQSPNLTNKVKRMEKYARRIAAEKLSSSASFCADDEILDRLGFLGNSLKAENSKLQGSVAMTMAKYILSRDPTSSLNPGRLQDGVRGPTTGPWEIYALCHHSQLSANSYQYSKVDASLREQVAANIEKSRRNISQFINGEVCLVPCWERTNKASFQSEATSVLASTILSIYNKELRSATTVDDSSLNAATKLSEVGNPKAIIRNKSSPTERILTRLEASGKQLAVKWEKYRPPQKYHPLSFFNSLESTPEKFSCAETQEKLDTFFSRRVQTSTVHESTLGLDSDAIQGILEEHTLSIVDFKATIPEQWGIYTWQGYKSDMLSVIGVKANGDNTTKIRKRLSSSLVDQGVQHRTIILSSPFEKIFEPRLLNLFWHVFHVDSSDCFIGHASALPDFSCQSSNTWCARITVRGWSISEVTEEDQVGRRNSYSTQTKKSKTKHAIKKVYQYDIPKTRSNESITVPDPLKDLHNLIHENDTDGEQVTPSVVKLSISSIVLSTNKFGDFSQCTIISERPGPKPGDIDKQCRALWEKFIHQPQSARCLVFLAILGLLCQQMEGDYRKAMNYFTQTLEIDKKVIFDNENMLKDEESLGQLKLSLWSLESLIELRNSLTDSVRTIKEAAAEMRNQINKGPGKRGEVLEKMCQDSLGDFARNLGQLVALNARFNQIVDLNSRYKDYLSTIWSLQDSRNSIYQNSIIQKLTYLTIGYLPLGLMTAIFAIPSDQNVLIPKMGLPGFVVAIAISLIVTFTIVFSLERILGGIGKLTAPSSPPHGGKNLRGLLLERSSRFMVPWNRPREKPEDEERAYAPVHASGLGSMVSTIQGSGTSPDEESNGREEIGARPLAG
ncbi:hypothetical protein F4814DRAFT_460539 [Daldinia grandis]|nr:hypothetical protein F4814DRAFT_460539 [Daldinia grandis]